MSVVNGRGDSCQRDRDENGHGFGGVSRSIVVPPGKCTESTHRHHNIWSGTLAPGYIPERAWGNYLGARIKRPWLLFLGPSFGLSRIE